MDTKKVADFNFKQALIWSGALILGYGLGMIGCSCLQDFFNFIASAYTQLFKFVAVPTIALAVMMTLADFGRNKGSGKIFGHTIVYTLLTTFAATMVGLVLYYVIAPSNLPADMVQSGADKIDANLMKQAEGFTVYRHILNAIPSNVLDPILRGNVLSILVIAALMGIGIAVMPDSDRKTALMNTVGGLQDLFFLIIRGIVWTLPLGIVAFSAQLAADVSGGMTAGSLGKYLAVVLLGNVIQFFVVLPIFLLCRGINPIRVMRGMLPAVLMALFTKSSAATLPVTVNSAKENLKAKPEVANFVLPICCTINMNGCAAFIFVTSLFVMQNGGIEITLPTMFIWALIAVISAVGNAGVPMGCYFLTLSLMAGVPNAPLGIMGVILPLYAIIDMIETAENVWSDSCVCAMVDKDMR